MDPLSLTMAVVGISGAISTLYTTVSQFKDDCKLADEDLDRLQRAESTLQGIVSIEQL